MCDRKGDGIDFAREYFGDDFRAACERIGAHEKIPPDSATFPATAGKSGKPGKAAPGEFPRIPPVSAIPSPAEPLASPGTTWQQRAGMLCDETAACLWTTDGARALAWLRARGLTDETIRTAGLGFNPADRHEARALWGFEDDGKPVWIPRGVVIPWTIAGELWRVNVRRAVRGEDDGPKYIGPAGSSNGLYGADGFRPGIPAVLVEGELDALTINQTAGELVTAVATGSTHGARRTRWIARLAARPLVLVAFDTDDAGEAAARYWCETLPNARRWRPYIHDANDMHRGGMDVRAWIEAGIGRVTTGVTTSNAREDDGGTFPQDDAGDLPPEAFEDDGGTTAKHRENAGGAPGENSRGTVGECSGENTRQILGKSSVGTRAKLGQMSGDMRASAVAVDVPGEATRGIPLPELRDVPQATAARLELIPIDDTGEDESEPRGRCAACGRKTFAKRARDGVWICFWCLAPATNPTAIKKRDSLKSGTKGDR